MLVLGIMARWPHVNPRVSGPEVMAQSDLQSKAYEIHYAPAENLETIDVGLIDSAQRHIDLAAYVLTDKAFVEALTRAAARNVVIRIYLDGSERRISMRNQAVIDRLVAAGNVAIRFKPPQPAIMHLKGFTVDGVTLRTGSANFSASGLKYQDNDLLIFRDPQSVQAFAEKFERMWQRQDYRRYPLDMGTNWR